jgi:uncharacterized membrane protein
MVWLFVFGLGVWCAIQQHRISTLSDKLDEFRTDVVRALRSQAGVQASSQSGAGSAVPASDSPESVSADTVSSPMETLLLRPVVPVVEPAARLEPPVMAPILSSPPPQQQQQQPAAPPPVAPSLSDWLSRNGLAWIGGGTLALGGLMLVAYAAQHGVFTPALRIASAVVLGFAALGVGERLRRLKAEPGRNPTLVAALTTAAGAAILYAAIWAAYVLYGFIPAAGAGALLAITSLSLLALALLHGEALGLLAIVAAYAVPVVSGGRWDGAALDAYVLLILATGLATTGLRQWARTGALALIGAGLWAVGRLSVGDGAGVMAIAIAAPAIALAAMHQARLRPDLASATAMLDIRQLPIAAVVGSSVIATLLWPHGVKLISPIYAGVCIAALAAVSATGLRLRLSPPYLLAAPAAAAVLAATLCSFPMSSFATANTDDLAWLLVAIAAVALAGFAGARTSPAGLIGAGGAALGLTLSSRALAAHWPGWDLEVDLAFAGLFAVGALALAQRASAPSTDLTLAAWIAAAAEACGLAIHAGVDPRLAPTAYGVLAILLAAFSLRLRWRGFAETAAVACLASFAALLGPAEAGAAFTGGASWIVLAAVALGAALAQLGAWRLLIAARTAPGAADAASTMAILSALLGAFLVLQRLTVPGLGVPAVLDGFTTASLRTILILAAGLTLALRGAATPFGRWRAPVFLAVGALHGLGWEALILHPWWGLSSPVAGPPVLDGIMLGLLVPGLMLAFGASRFTQAQRPLIGAALACALTFVAVWMVTEVRRLFHGPNLTIGLFGYAEVAAYGLALLALVVGLDIARRRLARLADTSSLLDIVLALTWASLAFALAVFGLWASPWWGPLTGPLRAPGLLLLLYVLACAGAGFIARVARRDGRQALARMAVAVTGAQAFALITLIVRYAFHGSAMRAPLREASLETWTYSAVWALYGFAVLALGASRRDLMLRGLGLTLLLATTAKVFLFDMARLEGVVRAASFLALGIVLLAAAVAARRLGAAKPEDQAVSM